MGPQPSRTGVALTGHNVSPSGTIRHLYDLKNTFRKTNKNVSHLDLNKDYTKYIYDSMQECKK